MGTSEMVDAYGNAWNESDESARRALLEQAWADDGVYCDPTARAEGRDALLAHIAGFRETFPGARIEMRSGVDEHGDNFRFAWALVDGEGNVSIEGVDFGRTAPDGRIASITGFFGPLV